jgi:hypothetical protein
MLTLVVITGCAEAPAPVTGPPPEMFVDAPGGPPDKAVMTFYRPRRGFGAVLNTSVFIDSVEIADLDNGTYVTAAVAPGRRQIHSDEAEDALWVEVEVGREYFYRIDLEMGFWKGHGRLVPVPGPDGQAHFRSLKLKQGKDIRVREMVLPSPSVTERAEG